MDQLFNNTKNSQQSHPIPPQYPPPSPPQIFHKNPQLPLRTKIIGVIMIMVVVIALPATVILSKQQQNFQQSAHILEPTVTAVCQGSMVILSSSFTISDIPSNVTCQIKVTDSQNYLTDNFPYKLNDSPHTKTVNTQQSTVTPGVVTFQTTCTSGFKKTNQLGYTMTKPCSSPTPTRTITPSEKATPTITRSVTPTIKITPTMCITPGQVTNVKVTCANCPNK